jgi:hypothetical protein
MFNPHASSSGSPSTWNSPTKFSAPRPSGIPTSLSPPATPEKKGLTKEEFEAKRMEALRRRQERLAGK